MAETLLSDGEQAETPEAVDGQPTGTEEHGEDIAEESPWYEGFDEDLQGIASKYVTPEEMARAYKEANGLISKKGLKPPAEDAGADEWAAWHKHIGVPDSPDAYAFEAPEGFTINDDAVEEARKALHEAGLTAKQFDRVMGLYIKQEQGRAALTSEQEAALRQESTAALEKQHGDKLPAVLDRAEKFLDKFGLLESVGKTSLKDSADFINGIHKLSSLLSDDTIEGTTPMRPRANVKTELDKVEKEIEGMDDLNPRRSELMTRRLELIGLLPDSELNS